MLSVNSYSFSLFNMHLYSSSSNSSFTECVKKNTSSFLLHNTDCASPSYEECSFTGPTHVIVTSTTSFLRCTFSTMSSDDQGAAIYSKSTALVSVTVTSCVLADCTAGMNGGAIYLSGINSLTVTGSVFQNCITNSEESEPGGGGIYVDGLESCLYVSTSSFINCKSTVGHRGGSGFFASQIKSLCTYSTRFISCSSTNAGGALFFLQVSNDLLVSDSLFSNNTADVHGGAIREVNDFISSIPHLKFSFFTANRAPDDHGNDLSIQPEITSSPFIHCFTTALSNRVAYNSGSGSHKYDDYWLP